jgi:hypothetical protein
MNLLRPLFIVIASAALVIAARADTEPLLTITTDSSDTNGAGTDFITINDSGVVDHNGVSYSTPTEDGLDVSVTNLVIDGWTLNVSGDPTPVGAPFGSMGLTVTGADNVTPTGDIYIFWSSGPYDLTQGEVLNSSLSVQSLTDPAIGGVGFRVIEDYDGDSLNAAVTPTLATGQDNYTGGISGSVPVTAPDGAITQELILTDAPPTTFTIKAVTSVPDVGSTGFLMLLSLAGIAAIVIVRRRAVA